MKEDIKEILYFDMYNDLDDKKYKKLLNYITNLQNEIEKLKENNKRKTSRCTERNHRIRARDRIIERRNKKINKLEDYKQRNEKAIEYIEKYEIGKYDYSIPMGGIIELKDILKGDTDGFNK